MTNKTERFCLSDSSLTQKVLVLNIAVASSPAIFRNKATRFFQQKEGQGEGKVVSHCQKLGQ